MKLKLVKKKNEAEGTKSFFFESETKVDYSPGQYFFITLPKLNYPDQRGETRHFTLSSSPTEQLLRITTRIRPESGYKKTLDEQVIGGVLEGRGPNGTFILEEETRDVQVFIAGGIGITPFRSMIKYSLDLNFKTPIYLIYSNSTPEEIAFRSDLDEMAKNNENIKVAMTISKPEESQVYWPGLTGRIDDKLLHKLFANWKLAINQLTFWVAGPPPMVDAIEILLASSNINPDHIKIEKFTGY